MAFVLHKQRPQEPTVSIVSTPGRANAKAVFSKLLMNITLLPFSDRRGRGRRRRRRRGDGPRAALVLG